VRGHDGERVRAGALHGDSLRYAVRRAIGEPSFPRTREPTAF